MTPLHHYILRTIDRMLAQRSLRLSICLSVIRKHGGMFSLSTQATYGLDNFVTTTARPIVPKCSIYGILDGNAPWSRTCVPASVTFWRDTEHNELQLPKANTQASHPLAAAVSTQPPQGHIKKLVS